MLSRAQKLSLRELAEEYHVSTWKLAYFHFKGRRMMKKSRKTPIMFKGMDVVMKRLSKKYNIYIALTMMLGFDHDDDSIFQETYTWLKKHLDSVILVNPHILTPYPGTAVYRQFLKENRIVDFDWRHYDHWHVVYKPRLMSADTLYNGYRWLLEKLSPMNSRNWQKWFQP